MKKRVNIKLGFMMDGTVREELIQAYVDDALFFLAQHNEKHPEDRWVRHGTYTRRIIIWVPSEKKKVAIYIQVIRFRSKRTGATCSYQGGYLIKNTEYAGIALLEFLARYARRKLGCSFEKACIYEFIPLKSARRIHKRLRAFLASKGAFGLITSKEPLDFLESFLNDFWFVPGNPFCSEMEAGMLTP